MVLAQLCQKLQTAGRAAEEARAQAREILEYVSGCSMAQILASDAEPFDAKQMRKIQNLYSQCSKGVPLAYLTGRAYFDGKEFAIQQNVLIPRRDTEILLDAVRRHMHKETKRVLDLCCGSGILGICLALDNENLEVVLVDISKDAVALTKENAKRHGVKVQVSKGDLFAPVQGQTFDLIVTNPPYIAAEDQTVEEQVREHEPKVALFAGKDGLDCIRRIAKEAKSVLNKKGVLALEHGATQQEAAIAIFAAEGFRLQERCCDLEGRPRAVVFERMDT